MNDHGSHGSFAVQVVYAPPPPATPIIKIIEIVAGSTIAEALVQSEIAADLPESALETCRVGIWGKLQTMTSAVPQGARIEIYRPLIADPKEARRRRAGSTGAAKE